MMRLKYKDGANTLSFCTANASSSIKTANVSAPGPYVTFTFPEYRKTMNYHSRDSTRDVASTMLSGLLKISCHVLAGFEESAFEAPGPSELLVSSFSEGSCSRLSIVKGQRQEEIN